MNKLILTMIVLGLSQKSSAFFSFKSIQDLASKTGTKSTLLKGTDTCVQLTGSWAGVCENDGKKKDDNLKIEQNGCFQVKITSNTGETTNLDLSGSGLNSKSESSVFYSLNMGVVGHWNADQTVVQLGAVALINSGFIASPRVFQLTGQMMMDGSDLVVFSRASGADEGNGDTSCRYKKQ